MYRDHDRVLPPQAARSREAILTRRWCETVQLTCGCGKRFYLWRRFYDQAADRGQRFACGDCRSGVLPDHS